MIKGTPITNIIKHIILVSAVFIGVINPNRVYAGTVQLDAMYTYEEMTADILELQTEFPASVQSGSIGTSCLGKSIPYIAVGNPSSSHNVFIQATVHGREYMVSQLVMGLAEYYLRNRSDILSNTCFYIVPMANPDGVEIAQFGTTRIFDPNVVAFINACGHQSQWKANALGTDINRNFSVGWATLPVVTLQPSYMEYKGATPGSAPETQALMSLAGARPYDCYISYHMQGNIIYYDEPGNTPANSVRSAMLAQAISGTTGYRTNNLISALAAGSTQQGGFTDWVQIAYDKPAVTIEVGGGLPPAAQSSMHGIYNSHLNTWNAVSVLYQ